MRTVLWAHNTMLGRLLLGPALVIGQFYWAELRALQRGDRGNLGIWAWHLPLAALVLLWVGSVCAIPWSAYLALFVLAARVDCGPALCAGVLLGDATSFVGLTLWHWRGEPVAFGAALALFALLFLVFGHRFDLPQEPAQRAILGLAAFGTVAGRLGRDLLGRLSGHEDDTG